MKLFTMNIRQLTFATVMGSIALAVRNMGFYVTILEPFKLDPRWIFSLLAACWTGPLGGLISGGLAAFKLPYPQLDLACIPVHFLIGLVARWLGTRNKQRLFACFLWPVLGVPAYWLATLLFLPMANPILIIPVLAFSGVSSSILSFLIGLAVERRLKSMLEL
jgi:uncharacterized membrane protein